MIAASVGPRLLLASLFLMAALGGGLWLEFLPHEHLAWGDLTLLERSHGHPPLAGASGAACDLEESGLLSLAGWMAHSALGGPVLPAPAAALPEPMESPVAMAVVLDRTRPLQQTLTPPRPPPRSA